MEIVEILPEMVELVFFGLSAVGLSLFSTHFGEIAFISAQNGELTFGVWAGYMAIVMLLFAYLIGTEKFIPKLAELKQTV